MNRPIRLIANSDFKAVLNKGRRTSTPEFNLYWSPGPSLRAGIMVSKKVSKLAVERNKVKRRLRDIVSKNVLPDFPYSLVIAAKPAILKVSYQSLKVSLVSKVKMIELMQSSRAEHKITRSSK